MDENRRQGFIIENGVLKKYYGTYEDVVIPDAVTVIGDKAFDDCFNLHGVVIGDNVTEIGDEAFFMCDDLTDIVIGRGLKRIGKNAFSGCCDLAGIYVDPQNKHFHSRNNCIIETASKTLVRGCTTSVIPDDGSIETIGDAAFDCADMKSVVIPSSVKYIGEEAFSDCDLAEIKLPEGLEHVGDGAFARCRKLERISIPASVTHVGRRAFAGCRCLNEIDVSLANMRYDVVGGCLIEAESKALIACFGNMRIPDDGRIKIIASRAFYENKNVEHIDLPRGVTEIEDDAFSSCTALKRISLPHGLAIVGDKAFHSCTSLENTEIPDSVVKIGKQAFRSCESLTAIKLPIGISEIADCTFERCHRLTSAFIPSSVTTIGSHAFAWDFDLSDIVYDGTVAQWNAIEKGDKWSLGAAKCVVRCTDGEVKKR